ncbi:MAG: hypothetical protein ABSC51_01170 [Gaiellaceae bacterium]|jgi:hypothetical protein
MSKGSRYSSKTVEQYEKFRDELAQSVLRQQQAYDQAVLKLAAAGLGLTVTLATALESADRHVQERLPLILAWAFLAASIASVLFSFVSSQIESIRRIGLIDAEEYEKVSATRSTKLTRWFNYGSGGLLVAGGFCLALFVTLNV